VAARYRPQVVLPQWQAFLERVAAGGAGRPVSAG
jgi:hypothetical protein